MRPLSSRTSLRSFRELKDIRVRLLQHTWSPSDNEGARSRHLLSLGLSLVHGSCDTSVWSPIVRTSSEHFLTCCARSDLGELVSEDGHLPPSGPNHRPPYPWDMPRASPLPSRCRLACIPLPLCLSCAPDITRERLRALFTSGQQGRLLLCAAHWRSACPLCGGDGDSVPDCPLQASGRAALHLSADCYSGTVRAGAPPLSPHDGCPKHCTGPAAATCRAEHVDACMPVAVKVYLHTCSSRANVWGVLVYDPPDVSSAPAGQSVCRCSGPCQCEYVRRIWQPHDRCGSGETLPVHGQSAMLSNLQGDNCLCKHHICLWAISQF